jgi:hypothetical protein
MQLQEATAVANSLSQQAPYLMAVVFQGVLFLGFLMWMARVILRRMRERDASMEIRHKRYTDDFASVVRSEQQIHVETIGTIKEMNTLLTQLVVTQKSTEENTEIALNLLRDLRSA